jgi:hypothetical protein
LGLGNNVVHLFYQSFGFIVIIRALWGPFVSGVFGATGFGDSAGLDTAGFGDSAGLDTAGFGDSAGLGISVLAGSTVLDVTAFIGSVGLGISVLAGSSGLGVSVLSGSADVGIFGSGCSGSNLPEINLLHSPKVLFTSWPLIIFSIAIGLNFHIFL